MADDPLVIVRHDDRETRLAPGAGLTFGRAPAAGGAPGGAPDADPTSPHLGLSDNPRLHAVAGRIDVDLRGWLLTNLGRWLHLRIVDVTAPNRTELPPGRTVRVPYSRCRVEIATGDETVGFDADCPWLGPADEGGPPAVALAGSTVEALGLDRTAGYFRALVALCAPRLRDPRSDEVSTEGEIARVLNGLPGETERVSLKAVERRLAHVRRKVGLSAADPCDGSAAGLEIRDAARQLADLAVRTGAVTSRDLDLLRPAGDDLRDDGTTSRAR